MEVVDGATCTLGGEVWNLAIAPIKPKTSGTIYAMVQLNKPGDADHGKYWDTNAGGSWQASPTTWPTATYQKGAFWNYAVPTGATTGKAGGYLDLTGLTDNANTPASSTVTDGGCQSAKIVEVATSTYLAHLDVDVGTRSTFAGGAVDSVTGDVGGKVLGGGASSIVGVGANSNVTQIDGNATNDNLATLKLKQLHVSNSTGDAIYAASTGSNGHGANLNGNGSGNGLRAISGTTGHGIYSKGGAGAGTQAGLRVEGGGAGPGISAVGAISGGAGSGIFAGSGGSGHGIESTGAATGHGIKATSGSGATGDGINTTAASTNGSGLRAVGSGSGIDLTGSLSGDVHGKVLGEGASSIVAVGARVVDASGNNVASDATAAAIQAKTDNLPLSPAATGDIPLAIDNASAVRTELAPELANMDSAVSDCLQASSYVAPDNATIASTAAGVSALPSAITASESAIRGTDSDTLKTISDQLDGKLEATSYVAPDNAGIAAIEAKTNNLPSDPADASVVAAEIASAEAAIRGVDGDTLKTLSDQIDLITPPLGHGTVTIRTVDEDGDPLDGVRITVYNMSDVFVAYGYTGGFLPGSGEVHFLVPASAGGISYKAYLYQAGVSFLPEAVKTFVVKDPPVGPDFNVFEYEGQVGLSGVMTNFVVVDTVSPTPNPVESVRVRIFSSPDDTFLTELSTDADGEASIVLEGAAGPAGKEYIIRLNPPSGYSGGPTRTIAVIDPLGPSETNTFDFTVYPPSEVPVSLDPDMCKVSGTFTNPSLHPLKNITLIFHPREGYPTKVIAGMPFSAEPTVVRSNIIASDLHVTTDKNGYIEIELPRKSVFDVFVQGLGAGDNTLQASIYIPDMAGIDVREILFPYLTTLTYLTTSLNMTVGDSEEVEVELTASNGQPITGVVALNALLVFESSDPTIALASVGSNGTLVIKALRAGSVTVQASRVVGSFAPRRPEVPDLVIAPSALTVTVT